MDFEELWRQVEKPGRYTGGEWGAAKKDPQKAEIKVALVFPDLYEVGMSHLGQKILYNELNRMPFILAERVYAPWVDFENVLREKEVPLYSLENRIPLWQFDIVGFSLLYELNYSNILTILDLGQIPFLSSRRESTFPLVIAGGPAVFNPEPVADIFDFFVIGDGEEVVKEICNLSIELKKGQEDKDEALKKFSKIPGVYVPSLYVPYLPLRSSLLAVKPKNDAPGKIKKRLFSSFPKAPNPENLVVPNIRVVFDRVAAEAERGCSQRCRFCQASSIYFPPRAKKPSLVVKDVLEGLHQTGCEDASLSALSIGDYPYLEETVKALMEELNREKIALSLSSLRPGRLSWDIMKNILKVRKTGLTLVPEAGTERLRRVISKNFLDEELWDASKNAFSQGWRLLKLYFMVGLPTETQDDLDGIAGMVKEIIRLSYSIRKRPPQINLSVSSFIPKPHTPFQWLKMEDEENLREKHRYLHSCLKKYRFVQFKKHPLKRSVLEAVFSRGDRKLAPVLIASWKMGARFDSWNGQFDFSVWEKAFESQGIDYHDYLSFLDQEAVLPWDHIDTGLKKTLFQKELERALKEDVTLSCRETECELCQGCTFVKHYAREIHKVRPIVPAEYPLFGEKTDEVFRYRAFYSKLHSAKFISHADLINMIQKGFRRARISVHHSRGFHPKMEISYSPALPLGMEGKEEVLDFQSSYLFSEKPFVYQVNKYLPESIRFFALKKLEPSDKSLTESIDTLVYSLSLNDEEMKQALARIRKQKNIQPGTDKEIIHIFLEERRHKLSNWLMKRVKVNDKRGKLFFEIDFLPRKMVRVQDAVREIFGIENPTFFMAREKIVLRNH